MIVLDTNIISEIMKSQPDERVLSWFHIQENESIAISVITIAEIEYGLARLPSGSRRKHLTRMFNGMIQDKALIKIYPIDDETAQLAGQLMAIRENMGRPITLQDMLIAATAHRNGRRLATRNIKDFEGLDLSLENPFLESFA
ncbi:MAG TPA: type II toxin-antitoxin system VapC family toxin [Hellea balneolensis]|uniref:Type II toxin-antitoxin system VapC family toxin n=1 Tax=Hellea balneolensis TaxID=287478 RepID=A0A7C5R776_9PROT|nr:type II toxin-antitoxin system VapC family toxin [Hellea balneolensis]